MPTRGSGKDANCHYYKTKGKSDSQNEKAAVKWLRTRDFEPTERKLLMTSSPPSPMLLMT